MDCSLLGSSIHGILQIFTSPGSFSDHAYLDLHWFTVASLLLTLHHTDAGQLSVLEVQ